MYVTKNVLVLVGPLFRSLLHFQQKRFSKIFFIHVENGHRLTHIETKWNFVCIFVHLRKDHSIHFPQNVMLVLTVVAQIETEKKREIIFFNSILKMFHTLKTFLLALHRLTVLNKKSPLVIVSPE